MAKKGTKIPDLTKDRVREQLADETDPKAIKRLTAAREYLEGLSGGDIEEKYGWDRQTVYNWLDRFEERGFDAAFYDNLVPDDLPISATNSSSSSSLSSTNCLKRPGTMPQPHGVQLSLSTLSHRSV